MYDHGTIANVSIKPGEQAIADGAKIFLRLD